MAKIIHERTAADIEGDVVLLIGMWINRFLRVDQWIWALRAMLQMLKELSREEDSGLLGFRLRPGIRNHEVVQYWRSFEHLHAYARLSEGGHLPAWVQFNRDVAENGAVGIWHETYLIKAGAYETIYHNMPPHGLGAATSLVGATGKRRTAAGRLGRTEGDDAPVSDLEGSSG